MLLPHFLSPSLREGFGWASLYAQITVHTSVRKPIAPESRHDGSKL